MTLRALLHTVKKSYVILRGVHMIIKLAIKVRVQQFEGGRRINFGFSFKLHSTAQLALGDVSKQQLYALSVYIQRFSTTGVPGDL